MTQPQSFILCGATGDLSARMLLPGIREGFTALERACNTLRAEDDILRMKAPSTLTMRWLLARLSRFRHLQPGNEVQTRSQPAAQLAMVVHHQLMSVDSSQLHRHAESNAADQWCTASLAMHTHRQHCQSRQLCPRT